MVSEIKVLRHNAELPEFKKALDRVLNKRAFDFILFPHSISKEELPQFVEKAVAEGNAVLIQREWNGYLVIVWKD